MSSVSVLINKLNDVHYPIKISDYSATIQKVHQETKRIQQQYTSIPPELTIFENDPWFQKNKELLCRYIREGRIAPVGEPSFEAIEPVCSICQSPNENVATGFNLIKCTNNPENHLICTSCLIGLASANSQQDHVSENQFVDLTNQQIFCQTCRKRAPIVFYPPTQDEIIQRAKDSGEQCQSSITYQRFCN